MVNFDHCNLLWNVFQLICNIPNDKIIHVNVFNYTNIHTHTHTPSIIGWKHITMNKNIVINIVFLDVAFWTNQANTKKIFFVMVLHIIVAKNMKKIQWLQVIKSFIEL